MPFIQDKLSQLFVEHVCGEVENARRQWPGNTDKLAALTEEVGELAQALSQYKSDKGDAMRIWREAVRVAALALRVAAEGSNDTSYRPHDALAQLGVELSGGPS